MKLKCEEIEIKAINYDNTIICCSLPCEWSNSPSGPVNVPCVLWDVEKKLCRKVGIWYHVLINDCAMIWEGNSVETAKVLDTVLRDIAERNNIKFKSCF